MRIGIISDTHSKYQTVDRVIELLRGMDVKMLIHCGDIEDAETVWLFEGFTTHFVWGNCDTQRLSVRQAIHGIAGMLHEPFGKLEIETYKIAWTHGDDHHLFQQLEASGEYDYLFYGHTHQAEQHRTGPTLVVNPGALHRARTKSFVVMDLDTCKLESVIVS